MSIINNSFSPEGTIVDQRHLDTPILIVDDLRDNVDLLKDILTDAGYTSLHFVLSGEEAIHLLREEAGFGLILLDMVMPGIDGCETCRRISSRTETAHIPIIMVTGGSLHREDALLRSFDAGAVDFINKPIQEVELYGRVRAALDLYHERMNSRRKTLALEKSEERFQLAVSGANDGIWDLNLLTGEAYLSPKWKSMLGFEPHELSNTMQVWEQFIHPADRNVVTEALQRHWQDHTSIYLTEHRLVARNGEVRWVLSRGKTIWDSEGRTVRMAGSTTDITSQKTLESQLRHIQKMESMGRFAGGIAHDFNNSLALISAYSQIILEEPRLPGTVEKYARDILNATENATTLTRQLLTLSRRSASDLRPIQLNNLLAPMGEMLGRILGRSIIYKQKLSPDLPPILADKSMMEQVILNLAINARDAMSRGTLTIETTACVITEDDCLANKEAHPGPAVRLRVSDTGAGMTEETIAQAFEPFFTTKSEGKGTGLGLYTVYGIVKQHKGWLTVKSKIDKGTSFALYFPALANSEIASISTTEPPLSGGGETILLVEDEVALREMARTILTGFNYRIITAGCGPEAIEVWEKHKDEISMLFTDIVMPKGLSGIDIGEKFHQEKPSLRILYTSGYQLDAIPRSMKIRETGTFIPKPYIPSDLAKVIRQVLDSH
jgi:two-component system, cell cycle sensor histidine kinase and response regulator CckA